jgi:large subunit ribosomal protein L18
MSKQLVHKQANRSRRQGRIRSVVHGTAKRPRLSVYVSNLHITAQLVDDENSKTLAYVTTVGQKSLKGNLTEKSEWVGTEIAQKAKAGKVKSIVFDRGGKLYHGRVAALADAARKEGLEF